MNCVLRLQPLLPLSLSRDATANTLPLPSRSPPLPTPNLQSLSSLSPYPIPASKSASPLLLASKNVDEPEKAPPQEESSSSGADDIFPRWALIGGASLALALVLTGADPRHQAVALGPEGPLMEEFWDNVRRYLLYALTVSTGAVYTISQPIIELLKNPVTAVLIVLVMAAAFYLLSQVLSAMVGINEFSYDYSY